MINEFSQKAKEELKYYVYILIDPRDFKIFYVGKGKGNRVFAHINDSLDDNKASDKLETIREIRKNELEVNHYIVRHGLENEEEAFTIESVLIDFLTYSDFSEVSKITNIVAGHHSFDRGIKTIEEIEALYNCTPLEDKNIVHNLLIININKTYYQKKIQKNGIYDRPNIYEATRKHWKLNVNRAKNVDYVLSEYKGIVRAIFKPNKWLASDEIEGRYMFEGNEVTDPKIADIYLNKDISKYKKRGDMSPIHYFFNH